MDRFDLEQRPLAGKRLRRARSLMLYLDGRRLVADDFLAGRRYQINDDALRLLQLCDRWRTLESLPGELPGYDPASVVGSADRLLRKGLLVAEGTAAARRQLALTAWAAWDRAATYLHFTTRQTRFARTPREVQKLVARVTRVPMPAIYKELPGPRIRLPPPRASLAPGRLGDALLRRRTWREFLSKPILRRQLEAVTVLTFARLALIDGGPFGTLIHRSAPSGGGRHPIECYVMALDVAGLRPGLYHYSVKDNALVFLKGEASREHLHQFTWGQSWFSDVAAAFILTAVFRRSQWKYRTPRAYRVVLIDAAHACQNLLLVATSLGLGAISVAAIDEPAIDRYLGLDGVTEGSLYMAGIGRPDRRRLARVVGRRRGLLPGGPV